MDNFMVILNCVIVFVSYVVHVTYTQDLLGFAFYEDTLIGPQYLFSNGTHRQRNSNDYHIALLAVEGNLDRFNLSQTSGYFLGFQWYNGNENTQTNINGAVMFQLYRPKNQSATEGDYTLAYQSGWINAQAGSNVYYFDEGIRFDANDSVVDSYVIALVMAKSGTVPVLQTDVSSCSGNKNIVLEAQVTSLPSIGDVLYFSHNTASSESCVSYSLQGIFAKSDLATSSQTSDGCSLYIAKYGETNARTVTSHTPFPGSGFPSGNGKTVCQIIRAEKQFQSLSLNKKVFQLPESDRCSGEVKLQIEEIEALVTFARTDMGTYCGTDKISFTSSFWPYIKLSLSTSTTMYGYQGYQFTVYAKDQPVENRFEGILIALIVLGACLSVVFIACIFGAVICCVCIKAGSSRNRTSTGIVVSPPSQPGVEMVTTGSPNNRLPPLQNSKE